MNQPQKDALWYATALLLFAAIVAVFWWRAPTPPPPRPVVSAYYVWQMQWNDDVREAVRAADPSASAFMALAGEVNVSAGELRLQRGYPDWESLAEIHAPVTLVLRANAALGDLLQSDARDKAVAFVTDALKSAIAEANAKGTTIRGVQLDYDCPSAKLASYKTLVDALRPRFDKLELSITALPTWLKWRDFEELAGGLTYYVLQVHSLDRPSTFDQPITLCDTARVPGYLRRAASIGAPYYLALPTYGYRFVFDEDGTFASLIAEGPAPALKPGQRIRTVMADPGEIADIVRAVRAQPPYALLGFVSFRLPIASDDLNWPWRTLEAVSDGRTPKTAFTAELRNPSPGLYELYIVNTGETAPVRGVRTTLRYAPGIVLASDTHNGFTAEEPTGGPTVLNGPAPRPGQSILAAWFRIQPNATNAPVAPITVAPVETSESINYRSL